MKVLPLFSLGLVLASPALAAPRSNLQQLQADADFYRSIFERQTEVCDLRVMLHREGFTISVKEGSSPVVYLDVPTYADVKMTSEEWSDGSYNHGYELDGVGKIEFAHMDDGYDHFYVTPAGGARVSCELDY